MFTRTSKNGAGKDYKIITGLWDYLDEQKTATDANPVVAATGNFAGVTKAVFSGAYAYNMPTQNSGRLMDATLNEWIKTPPLGENSRAWRYIKITPTQILLGHGGYDSTSNSAYGIVKEIILLYE